MDAFADKVSDLKQKRSSSTSFSDVYRRFMNILKKQMSVLDMVT